MRHDLVFFPLIKGSEFYVEAFTLSEEENTEKEEEIYGETSFL